MEQNSKEITPWTAPNGPVSGKVARAALGIKALLQRDMSAEDVQLVNRCCDAILLDVARIHELESALPCNCGMPCAVVIAPRQDDHSSLN